MNYNKIHEIIQIFSDNDNFLILIHDHRVGGGGSAVNSHHIHLSRFPLSFRERSGRRCLHRFPVSGLLSGRVPQKNLRDVLKLKNCLLIQSDIRQQLPVYTETVG